MKLGARKAGMACEETVRFWLWGVLPIPDREGRTPRRHPWDARSPKLPGFPRRCFRGYTIPSEIGAGWGCGTDRYAEIFRARIERAEFT